MTPYTGIPEQLGSIMKEQRAEMAEAIESLARILTNSSVVEKLREQQAKMNAIITGLDFAEDNSVQPDSDSLYEYDRLACWFLGFSQALEMLELTSTADTGFLDYPEAGTSLQYQVLANADQVEKSDFRNDYDWVQAYTRQGMLIRNRIVVHFENKKDAQGLYSLLKSRNMVHFRNWMD